MNNQKNFASLSVKEKRANPPITESKKLGRTLSATIRIELHPTPRVDGWAQDPTFRCAVLFRGSVVAQFKPTRSTSERTRKALLKKARAFIFKVAAAHNCAAFLAYEETLFHNFAPDKMDEKYVLGAYAPERVPMPTFEN
jgi:hypothetical protein